MARSSIEIIRADHLDPDDEDSLGVDENPGAGDVESLDEPGAAAATEVVGGDMPAAEVVLDEGSRVRRHHLRCIGGEDDLVDVVRGETGVLEGDQGGVGGQGHGRLMVRDESSPLDPGSLRDPLVAGVHQVRPLVVGDDPRRRVAPEPEDVRHGPGE